MLRRLFRRSGQSAAPTQPCSKARPRKARLPTQSCAVSQRRRACGKWKLKVDVSSIDLSRITSNPVGLSVELPDGSSAVSRSTTRSVDR